MGWNNLSIPKLQRLHRWSLGMDKLFHPTSYNGCNHLSMLGLKLNHVSKMGHCSLRVMICRFRTCHVKLYLLNNRSAGSYCSQPTWHTHDDGMKWELFPCFWPIVMGIHRSPVDSTHKKSVIVAWLFLYIFMFNPSKRLDNQWGWG